jgi:HEAT repeat protein
MLGLFYSSLACPVPTLEKVWVEERLRWLAGEFGPRRLLEARVVEPTPQFFPEPYDESREAAAGIFRRVGDYMGVPPQRVRLEFLDEEVWQSGDYSRYEPERVRLNERTFAEPMQLAATCAHELAHALLLGDERIAEEARDHERTTDLLMVYVGLGVIATNAAIQDGRGSSYRHGYSFEREFAYALAVFAWLRGERKPGWAAHLNPSPRRVFEEGLAYLEKSGDCLVGRDEFPRIDDRLVQTPLQELTEALHSPSPGRRLTSLWELQRWPALVAGAASAIAPLLNDRDVDVRREAAIALGLAGPDSAAACAALLDAALGEPAVGVRATVAGSLGRLAAPSPDCAPTLLRLLGDETSIRASAVWALARYADTLNERQIDRLCEVCAADPSLEVREDALATVAALPRGQLLRVLPELLLLFEAPDRELFGPLLRVLARLGPDAAAAEPQIRTMLRRGDPLGRAAAALALARISGSARDAVRALRHTRPLPLKGDRLHGDGYAPGVQEVVADVLLDLGEAAVEPLLELLPGKTLADTAFVAWALAQVRPAPDRARPPLTALLKHGERLVRFLAAVALGRFERPDDPVAAVWLDLLARRPLPGRHPATIEECLGRAAAAILMEIGEPLAPAAVAALDGPAVADGITNWLGDLAAIRPAVHALLIHEQSRATGEPRRRLDNALHRYTVAVDAQRHLEHRTLSFPPVIDTPPDPVELALQQFWGWLTHLAPKPEKSPPSE